MADIKQAAKWMQEGKKVRRRQWPSLVIKEDDEGVTAIVDADPIPQIINPLETADLLADDWEIAE